MSTRAFGGWADLEDRGHGVWVLRLHDPGGGYFVFNEASVAALEEAVAAADRIPGIEGLVITGNDRGFVAGADVRMILAVEDRAEAVRMSKRGQALFAALGSKPFVTVAAIHGPCLGGGMELALALDWRVASRAKTTKLGLPEVRLGILPGWGGTQRLPRLVGLPAALELMLEGKQLDGRRALRRGLVDRLVPEPWVVERAADLVGRGKPKRSLPLVTRFLTFYRVGRGLVRRRAEPKLETGMGRFLPAPRRILDVSLAGLAAGPAGGYDAEAEALGDLATGPISKHLIRLFLESEKARKLHRGLDPDAKPIASACVVGAGVMGAGIAGLLARRGVRTRLVDLDPKALGAAVARLAAVVAQARRRRRLEEHEAQACLDRLCPGTKLAGFAGADLVLEAVAEELDLKRKIFAEAARSAGADAVLATNTSSLPLDEMGRGLPHPERLVGLHFFNPPEKMPLVEVVRHPGASPQALARAARLATDLGKIPVLVEQCPGFLVNRCLSPYLGMSVKLLEEGVAPGRIDRVAEAFGMPMGPLRLLDEVGWDIAAQVCRIMEEAFPDRMEAPSFLAAMHEQGLLGRKSGTGVYTYPKNGRGRRQPSAAARDLLRRFARSVPRAPSDDDIRDRLLLPLVSEAFRCLEEGIVESAGQLDLAMVMGIGFPPHHGGPIAWARARGLERIAGRMRELASVQGAPLEPSGALVAAAREEAAGPTTDGAHTTNTVSTPGSSER